MPTRLNFARMRTTTGGTGTLTLLPVTGRPTFNQALANTTGTFTEFKYTVIDQASGAYEIGTATYDATGPSISSRSVIESWNGSGDVGTSLINFGTSNIFVYCGTFHQDILNADETAGLANNAVTDAYLRDSAGLSVLGRSANTSGDPADIVAGTDQHVLRRSANTVGFGTIDASVIGSGTVAAARLGSGTANSTTVLYGNGQWAPSVGGNGASTLAQLSDVDDAIVANNKFVLVANGTTFGARQLATTDLSDITTANGAANGELLIWNTANNDFDIRRLVVADINATGTQNSTTSLHGDGTWKVPVGSGNGASTLGQLTDVADAVATTNAYVLIANGTQYEGRALTTADVSNITEATGNANGQLLVWTTANSKFEIRKLATTDLSDVSEVSGAANNDMLMWSAANTDWIVRSTSYVKTAMALDKVSITIQDSAPADGTVQLTLNAPYPGTITSFTHKLASGNTNIAIKINGNDVTGLANVAPTSTKTTTNATANNAFVANDEITMVYSLSATPGAFTGSLNITR